MSTAALLPAFLLVLWLVPAVLLVGLYVRLWWTDRLSSGKIFPAQLAPRPIPCSSEPKDLFSSLARCSNVFAQTPWYVLTGADVALREEAGQPRVFTPEVGPDSRQVKLFLN